MKTYSLVRRLITAVVLVQLSSTFLLLASAGIYESISHFRVFDIMLRGRADSLIGAVQDAGDEQDNIMLDGTELRSPKRDVYGVRDETRRILGNSPNWPSVNSAFEETNEFRNLSIDGRRYRVIRVEGLRTVDPGEKGGVPRRVVVLYGAPVHPVWRSIGHAMTFYAVLSLLLLGISVLIMLRLLRSGFQPLHELAAYASQVSVESWNFAPSKKVREVRELRPLAVALETVLAGLERSFDQQRLFVSDAAHELKTSVSVVKSSLQLLLLRDRTASEYRTGIERAEHDCERMEELTATMLTLAALEAGLPEASKAQLVNCLRVLSDVVEQFRTIAELSGINLVLLADSMAWVKGDREQLKLLCSNLLHNALQHSSSGSQVHAIARITGDKVEIRIEDEGEGIESDILPHIFDRFYRGDTSRSRKTGGTGLGLAISKAIVGRMNGQIFIESQFGAGTQSVVLIPKATEQV